jgi:hypothetical protein
MFVYIRRTSESPCDDPHSPTQGKGVGGGGDGHTVAFVPVDQLAANLIPPLRAQVEVDIRRVFSTLMQEPLEEPAIAEGLGLGEPETLPESVQHFFYNSPVNSLFQTRSCLAFIESPL